MIHISHIWEKGTTVYEVNGKEVDISQPQYGKNLKASEYRELLNYLRCVEREKRRVIEDDNRHLFD
jgi:hypothetical protein